MPRVKNEKDSVRFIQELAEIDGPFQSPINISFKDVQRVDLPPLEWNKAQLLPRSMQLDNSGQTVQLTAKWNCDRPYLTGGPLDGKYTFSQIHFHWGSNDSKGSEHTVDGECMPLEMHVVHYKSDYATPEAALRERDGTLVLVYLFKLTREVNTSLQRIVAALQCVREPRSSHKMEPRSILALVHPFTDDYFLYWGSIITPQCGHVVLYMICRHPFGISSRQLNVFRTLLDTSHRPIRRNNRDPQPVHARQVYHINPGCSLEVALLPVKHIVSCFCGDEKKTGVGCAQRQPRHKRLETTDTEDTDQSKPHQESNVTFDQNILVFQQALAHEKKAGDADRNKALVKNVIESLDKLKTETSAKLTELETISKRLTTMKDNCSDLEEKKQLQEMYDLISRQHLFTIRKSESCFQDIEKLAQEYYFYPHFNKEKPAVVTKQTYHLYPVVKQSFSHKILNLIRGYINELDASTGTSNICSDLTKPQKAQRRETAKGRLNVTDIEHHVAFHQPEPESADNPKETKNKPRKKPATVTLHPARETFPITDKPHSEKDKCTMKEVEEKALSAGDTPDTDDVVNFSAKDSSCGYEVPVPCRLQRKVNQPRWNTITRTRYLKTKEKMKGKEPPDISPTRSPVRKRTKVEPPETDLMSESNTSAEGEYKKKEGSVKGSSLDLQREDVERAVDFTARAANSFLGSHNSTDEVEWQCPTHASTSSEAHVKEVRSVTCLIETPDRTKPEQDFIKRNKLMAGRYSRKKTPVCDKEVSTPPQDKTEEGVNVKELYRRKHNVHAFMVTTHITPPSGILQKKEIKKNLNELLKLDKQMSEDMAVNIDNTINYINTLLSEDYVGSAIIEKPPLQDSCTEFSINRDGWGDALAGHQVNIADTSNTKQKKRRNKGSTPKETLKTILQDEYSITPNNNELAILHVREYDNPKSPESEDSLN